MLTCESNYMIFNLLDSRWNWTLYFAKEATISLQMGLFDRKHQLESENISTQTTVCPNRFSYWQRFVVVVRAMRQRQNIILSWLYEDKPIAAWSTFHNIALMQWFSFVAREQHIFFQHVVIH